MTSTGMGGIILLKLIYKKLDYKLCESFDVNSYFRFYYDNNFLSIYDKIYITDLHLNKENLELINNDLVLKNKIILFDHNESVTDFNSYDFVNIIIKDEKGYCCSTSLLYQYLVLNKLIRHTKALDTFCEATRCYDVGIWDYSCKYDISRNLALLFDIFGAKKYIDTMYKRLKWHRDFFFTPVEIETIQVKKNMNAVKVKSYIQNAKVKHIYGYSAGIIFLKYEFRNEVAQYLRNNNILDVDLVMLVATNKAALSIRNINPNVNVRPIAEDLGGQGHFGAAGCDITKNNFKKISEVIA